MENMTVNTELIDIAKQSDVLWLHKNEFAIKRIAYLCSVDIEDVERIVETYASNETKWKQDYTTLNIAIPAPLHG